MNATLWTPERVKQIQDHAKNNNITIAAAAKNLKMSVAAYYKAKAKMTNAPTRSYVRRGPVKAAASIKPVTLEMSSPTSNNKIVILIADRSQIKSILSEMM